MRHGSVALVPLMLGIFLLFWFIFFMGGESNNLHNISQVQHLHNTQEKLLVAAVKRKFELQKANPQMSEAELDGAVDGYIHTIMVSNKIDD